MGSKGIFITSKRKKKTQQTENELARRVITETEIFVFF